mgnify:CR=1 FL=1
MQFPEPRGRGGGKAVIARLRIARNEQDRQPLSLGDGQAAFLTGGVSRKMHLHARRIRIDHPDGLADPRGYLRRLSMATGGAWIAAKKILEGSEDLPEDWVCPLCQEGKEVFEPID